MSVFKISNPMKKLLFIILVVLTAAFISVRDSSAQECKTTKNDAKMLEENINRELMKKDGASDVGIDAWIVQRKLLLQQQKNRPTQITVQSHAINANSCGEMGGENGWGLWQASIGDYADHGVTSTITYSQQNISPSTYPTRFVLTSGTGKDACTTGLTSPAISNVAPGFGNASIQLGQLTTTGMQGGCNIGCVERLTYSFTVTSADTNFIYACAFVMNNRTLNGQPDHTAMQSPFAEIFILDSIGNIIPCSHQKYLGDTLGQTIFSSGIYPAQSACGFGDSAKYKPWTVAGVNLAKYVGKTLTVHLINADCTQGGHYCHSYWDFKCGTNSFTACKGLSMCGPASDPGNTYTYTWYKNLKAGTGGTPIATSQCINPVSMPGDTFSVVVHQPSGCDFSMSYAPIVGSLQSLFTYSTNANVISFSDLSVGAVTYAWNFGDGNTSVQENPIHVYVADGTYSACLTVTSSEGCRDTLCQGVTISTASIKENDLISMISVFPSPVSKTIFLDFGAKNFGSAEVSISNLVGEKLYQTNIPASGKRELSISDFSNGIYFLQLQTDYGIATKKIIIEK